MTNSEKYDKIFTEILGADAAHLDESFTFKNISQWDSVAHLSLIGQLEDTFDVMFDSEDILHYGSYENGKKILRKMGVEI